MNSSCSKDEAEPSSQSDSSESQTNSEHDDVNSDRVDSDSVEEIEKTRTRGALSNWHCIASYISFSRIDSADPIVIDASNAVRITRPPPPPPKKVANYRANVLSSHNREDKCCESPIRYSSSQRNQLQSQTSEDTMDYARATRIKWTWWSLCQMGEQRETKKDRSK